MRKRTTDETRRRPTCGRIENQQGTESRGNTAAHVERMPAMRKENICKWIEKAAMIVENAPDVFELDESCRLIERKPRTET